MNIDKMKKAELIAYINNLETKIEQYDKTLDAYVIKDKSSYDRIYKIALGISLVINILSISLYIFI